MIIKFTKHGIEIITELFVPLVGLTEHKEILSYAMLPSDFMNFTIESITPEIEGGVLKALVFKVDLPYNEDKLVKSIDSKTPFKGLKFIDRIITPKHKIGIIVYQNTRTGKGYWISSERAKRHKLLFALSRKSYDKMHLWLHKQLLPQTYMQLLNQAKNDKMCSHAMFQNFIVVAMAKKDVKCNHQGKRTIISLPKQQSTNHQNT